MTGKRRNLLFAAVMMAAVPVPGTAIADVEGIGVELEPRTVPVGEGTVLSVRVRGGDSKNKPVIKADPSIRVQDAGENRSYQFAINNGRTTRVNDLIFTYVVRPSKTGNFEIKVEVPDGDEVLIPKSVTLMARNKTEQEKKLEPFLRLNLDSPVLYVGQTVPVEVSIYYSEETRLLVQANNRPQIEVDGMLIEDMSDWLEGGRSRGYRRAVASAQLTTLKPGKFRIGPSKYVATIRMPRYLRGGQSKAFELESDFLDVEVKALSTTGVPEGFDGLVGSFNVGIVASPLELDSGDPISVKLRVTGEGDFRKVEMPKMKEAEGWRLYEAERFEEKDRKGKLTGMAFTQVIVPTGDVSEIPPFELPHFDPARGVYDVAATNPIPIKLTFKETPAAVAAGSPVPTGLVEGPDEVDPPEAAMNDILTIRTGFAQSWSQPRSSILQSPVFWGMQAVPASLLAVALLVAARRSILEKRNRKEPQSWSDAHADFRRAASRSSAREFYRLAAECVDAWERACEAPAGSNGSHPEGEEVREGVQRIRGRHDFLEFGGSDAAGARDVDGPERERVSRTLDLLGESIRRPVPA